MKYFSNEGDTCLDFCMGSGSTGVACHTLGRDFIGIELHPEHFEIASKRLNDLPIYDCYAVGECEEQYSTEPTFTETPNDASAEQHDEGSP